MPIISKKFYNTAAPSLMQLLQYKLTDSKSKLQYNVQFCMNLPSY